MMSVKERLRELIEDLPESDLLVVERLLHGLKLTQGEAVDPLCAFLESCPEDDEPYTEDEQRADAAAWERYRRGQHVPHEDVLRRAQDLVP